MTSPTGSVCVDVFHRFVTLVTLGVFHGQVHAALATHTRWSNHVVTIRVCPITNEFGVNLGATSLGVFQFFQDDNTTSTGNHKTISALIKGSGSSFGIFIVRSAEGTHAVKHTGKLPVDAFTCCVFFEASK
jgi:hypothetical protein